MSGKEERDRSRSPVDEENGLRPVDQLEESKKWTVRLRYEHNSVRMASVLSDKKLKIADESENFEIEDLQTQTKILIAKKVAADYEIAEMERRFQERKLKFQKDTEFFNDKMDRFQEPLTEGYVDLATALEYERFKEGGVEYANRVQAASRRDGPIAFYAAEAGFPFLQDGPYKYHDDGDAQNKCIGAGNKNAAGDEECADNFPIDALIQDSVGLNPNDFDQYLYKSKGNVQDSQSPKPKPN